MSDGFWDWAVAAYAAPGVAEECLHLQDVHEQAVPLLLWAAWQAETGRAPDEEALEGAVDTTQVWADQRRTGVQSRPNRSSARPTDWSIISSMEAGFA